MAVILRSVVRFLDCAEFTLSEQRESNGLGSEQKTRTDFSIRVLKFYPTGAVQVNLPFPFGKRRMTVAAESDFQ